MVNERMAKGVHSKAKIAKKLRFPGPGRPRKSKSDGKIAPVKKDKSISPLQPHTKELFRTDFINAMRLNDTDVVIREKCLRLVDPWRQEWNLGVQTPAHPNQEKATICFETEPPEAASSSSFKLPKKYGSKRKREKEASIERIAEEVCRYDLDELDTSWLELLNEQRLVAGLDPVGELEMERIMDALETTVYDEIQNHLLNSGLGSKGRELDANAVCDVCYHGDTYEDDEIVFCDRCDLAVHQTCYGVIRVPDGPWVCRACSLRAGEVSCILCPNKNGAFKCTGSGTTWAHVSCVWWIPEVKFEDCEQMEPIINIGKIPAGRWNLKCSLCNKKEGACIQCTYSKCIEAFHVTCAQRRGLFMEMKPKSGDDYLDLESYCARHSAEHDLKAESKGTPPPSRPQGFPPSPSRLLPESPIKKKRRRQQALESIFYTFPDPQTVSQRLDLPCSLVLCIFEYWKLKRRAKGNKPLVTPKEEEAELLEKHEREALTRRIKALLQLRQNLEKARNLCYMVQKRERLRREYCKVLEEQFQLINHCVDDKRLNERGAEKWGKHLEASSEYEAAAYAEEANQENTSKLSQNFLSPTTELTPLPSPSRMSTPKKRQSLLLEKKLRRSYEERHKVNAATLCPNPM